MVEQGTNNDNRFDSNSDQENPTTTTNCEAQVLLNVYDLTPINDYTHWFGFGIFHSGIEVHGKEYGFGAHEFPVSGVFEVEPKSCPGFIYRTSIPLGRTNMPPLEFRTFIEGVSSEYHGDTYHLIYKNCNHFTDDMSNKLTGKQIPGLAQLGALCSCLLPESVQVTAVKQLPEYHECTEEDGSESLATTTPRQSTDFDEMDGEKHLLLQSSASEGFFCKRTTKIKLKHLNLKSMLPGVAVIFQNSRAVQLLTSAHEMVYNEHLNIESHIRLFW